MHRNILNAKVYLLSEMLKEMVENFAINHLLCTFVGINRFFERLIRVIINVMRGLCHWYFIVFYGEIAVPEIT